MNLRLFEFSQDILKSPALTITILVLVVNDAKKN